MNRNHSASSLSSFSLSQNTTHLSHGTTRVMMLSSQRDVPLSPAGLQREGGIIRVLVPQYLCRGDASLQCSNPASAVGAPMCPTGNPPGAASSRWATDTTVLCSCPGWNLWPLGSAAHADLWGSEKKHQKLYSLSCCIHTLWLWQQELSLRLYEISFHGGKNAVCWCMSDLALVVFLEPLAQSNQTALLHER